MQNIIIYKHRKYGQFRLIIDGGQVFIPVNEIAKVFGHSRGYQAAEHCLTRKKFRMDSDSGNGEERLYVASDELLKLKRKRGPIHLPDFEKWMSDTIEDARHKKIIHQPDLFSDIRISELQKENKDLKDEINALRRKIENIRVEVL